MTTKRMILAAILAGGAAALATVRPTKAACGIICVDKINKCGQRYGGYCSSSPFFFFFYGIIHLPILRHEPDIRLERYANARAQ
jgi:hypothetical protein